MLGEHLSLSYMFVLLTGMVVCGKHKMTAISAICIGAAHPTTWAFYHLIPDGQPNPRVPWGPEEQQCPNGTLWVARQPLGSPQGRAQNGGGLC